MRRLGLLLLVWPCAAFSVCGPGPDPLPPEDICVTAVTPAGTFTLDLAGQADPFVPWSDGQEVPMVRGGQGLNMVVVRARLVGADDTSCIRLTVRVAIDDAMAGERAVTVATYADGAGRTTKPLYVPLDFGVAGQQAVVDATVGSVTTRRTVNLR